MNSVSCSAGEVVVVNYHYCHPSNHVFNGLKGVTPQEFERQLIELTQRYEVCGLRYAIENAEKSLKPLAVLTFDDGLKDTVDYILPIIKKYNTTAVFYVSSAPYTSGKLLQVHRIHILQARLGIEEFQRRIRGELTKLSYPVSYDETARIGIKSLYPHDTAGVRSFKTDLNYRLPYPVVEKLLSDLIEEEFGDEAELVERFYLSLEDIETCQKGGLELGLHSHNHYVMSRLSEAKQAHEIVACLDFFKKNFGGDTYSFSYPYGIEGTFDYRTTALISKEPAIYSAVTLARRKATNKDLRGRFEIPRLDNRDFFNRGRI